jgi:hypothetical protein
MIRLLILLALLNPPLAAEDRDYSIAKRQESYSCLSCHSLRIIHSQRLSKQAWIRELNKMESWGALIQEREALLDYLSDQFGVNTPPSPPPLSQDGTTTTKPAKK